MIGWVWTLNLHVSKMAAMGKPPIALDYCICLVIKERISEIISMTQVNHTIYVHPGQFAAKNPTWPPQMVCMVYGHQKLNRMLITMSGCVWTPNLGVSKMAETQK